MKLTKIKGVPLPERKLQPEVKKMMELDVDGSFILHNFTERQVRNLRTRFRELKPKRFSIRKKADVYRCWRIK